MIDTKDLNIGCHYKIDGEIRPFEESDWFAIGESLLFIQDIEPIELSEDILLKCGFSEGVVNVLENDNYKIAITYYDGWMLNYEEKKGFGNSKVNLYPANIYHLHQLQQLYKSLTQEDLEIKQ